jgi:hypothetical protein
MNLIKYMLYIKRNINAVNNHIVICDRLLPTRILTTTIFYFLNFILGQRLTAHTPPQK